MAEWTLDEHNTWNLRFRNVHIWIESRPAYCDRGHFVGKVSGIETIDSADGFPRYFMNLNRAKAEMYEWLLWRLIREADQTPVPVEAFFAKPAPHQEAVQRLLKRIEERGEWLTLEDGFVYYDPSQRGALSPWMLRAIADELDRRNAAWQAQIDNDPAIGSPGEDINLS